MKRRGVQQFLIRTLVCFLVIGGAVFYFTQSKSDEAPVPTVKENRTLLMGLIIENRLRSSSIAEYSANDPQTADSLVRLVKELENNVDTIDRTAPLVALDANLTSEIQIYITIQREAIKKFRTANSLFAKAITYDPVQDLTLLNTTTDRAEIVTRANAAALGLERIISAADTTTAGQLGVGTVDGPAALASEPVRQAISRQIACLRNIVNQSGTTTAQFNDSVRQCSDNYPSLRKLAVQNVLSLSFNDQYIDKLQAVTLALLEQLKATSS